MVSQCVLLWSTWAPLAFKGSLRQAIAGESIGTFWNDFIDEVVTHPVDTFGSVAAVRRDVQLSTVIVVVANAPGRFVQHQTKGQTLHAGPCSLVHFCTDSFHLPIFADVFVFCCNAMLMLCRSTGNNQSTSSGLKSRKRDFFLVALGKRHFEVGAKASKYCPHPSCGIG